MALQGTLDTFALGDLIRLLTTTEKTGGLAVEGGEVHGRLWFGDGALIGAGDRGDAEPASVLFDLLRLEDEGDFRFEVDVRPEVTCEPASASDLLAEAEARVEEWRPIAELVPSPEVAVTLRTDVEGDDVTVSAEAWRQVVAIGSGTTAGGLAEALGLDEVATGFAIRDLVEAGVVDVGERVAAEDAVEPEEAEDRDSGDEAPDPEAELDAWSSVEPVVAEEPPLGNGEDAAVGAVGDESLAVDLDATLAGGTNGHSYLDSGPVDSALPEPLPVGPEALPEGPVDDASADDDDILRPGVRRRIISTHKG